MFIDDWSPNPRRAFLPVFHRRCGLRGSRCLSGNPTTARARQLFYLAASRVVYNPAEGSGSHGSAAARQRRSEDFQSSASASRSALDNSASRARIASTRWGSFSARSVVSFGSAAMLNNSVFQQDAERSDGRQHHQLPPPFWLGPLKNSSITRAAWCVGVVQADDLEIAVGLRLGHRADDLLDVLPGLRVVGVDDQLVADGRDRDRLGVRVGRRALPAGPGAAACRRRRYRCRGSAMGCIGVASACSGVSRLRLGHRGHRHDHLDRRRRGPPGAFCRTVAIWLALPCSRLMIQTLPTPAGPSSALRAISTSATCSSDPLTRMALRVVSRLDHRADQRLGVLREHVLAGCSPASVASSVLSGSSLTTLTLAALRVALDDAGDVHQVRRRGVHHDLVGPDRP